ncbi:GliA [Colletotrichum fioriniae PJ7]|uniref:GliA n=1 Tax=Colletotrichum fioriniae PJ7 TaxID=1445577 RepID=A0A010S078_9PEZI|nr:GliA [Colletotrichum fioriniae PJ7]
MDAAKSQSTKVDSWFFQNLDDNREPYLRRISTGNNTLSDRLQFNIDDGQRLTDPIKPDEDEGKYPEGITLVLIILALALGLFEFALDATIVATAIPVITTEFKALADAGWYGSAYLMTIASFQVPWGKLYKFFIPKWIFLAALIIFAVGSVLCAIAPNSAFLIAGRAVQGIGAAGLTGGVYVILALVTPRSKTPIYLGAFGAIFTSASSLGPIIGGFLTERFSWRWCFWINIPFSVLAGIIVLFFFKIPSTVKTVRAPWKSILRQMDLIGVVLITGIIALFVTAMESGGIKHEWDSGFVVGTLMGSITIAMLFGFEQYFMKEDALLQARFLTNMKIGFLCVFAFMLSSVAYSIQYNLPVYFQATKGFTPAQSGVNVLPLLIGGAFLTLLSSVAYSKYRNDRLYCVLSGALTVLGSTLILTLGPDSTPVQYLLYQLIVAFGYGLGTQVPVLAVQATVDVQDVPQATSIVLLFQLLSGALAVSAAQNLFNNIMLQNALRNVPSLSAAQILAAGSTDLRKLFSADIAPQIIAAYTEGLRASWAMGIGFAGGAMISGVFVGA